MAEEYGVEAAIEAVFTDEDLANWPSLEDDLLAGTEVKRVMQIPNWFWDDEMEMPVYVPPDDHSASAESIRHQTDLIYIATWDPDGRS